MVPNLVRIWNQARSLIVTTISVKLLDSLRLK